MTSGRKTLSFFKKLKKVFKSIANIVTAPVQAVINIAVKVVVPILKAVAEIEGLVYNGIKQISDTLAVGPSWIKNLALRINQIAYDSAMFSSRGQLGVGLLALGIASKDKSLRTEGRLEMLSATLYFARATGAVPQWLMMIVMVIIAIFFPWAAVIIMLVFIGVFLVAKLEIPKLNDEPEALLKHLMVLSKYGLLDAASNALLMQYAAEKSKGYLFDETVAGPFSPGVDNVYVDILPILEDIKKQLEKPVPGDGTIYVPGPTTPPPADQARTADSDAIIKIVAALGVGLLAARLM